jgi:hypothetical protein
MTNSDSVAVLTGDLIKYTKFAGKSSDYIACLTTALENISKNYNFNYQIFRGDSFQGILKNPNQALKVALIIRAYLLSQPEKQITTNYNLAPFRRQRCDSRISIGLGQADYDIINVGRSDGAAFRSSGYGLDDMKRRKQSLIIYTPSQDYNAELEIECALLDAVISHWTREQAAAMFLALQGSNQSKISQILKNTQSGVSQKLSRAGYGEIEKMMKRFSDKANQSMLNFDSGQGN